MQDLETEIFLHLLQQHRSALAGLAGDAEVAAARASATSSDGMAPVRWQHQPCAKASCCPATSFWLIASSVSSWKGQLELSLIKKGCDGKCLCFAGSVARQMEESWGG